MDISEYTQKDLQLAAKEFWAFTPSYVRICYDAYGHSPHSSIQSLLEFIFKRAEKGSKFHADVYSQLPWTPDDDRRAYARGWSLSSVGIMSANNRKAPDEFMGNEKAAVAVQKANDEGDPVAMKAIVIIARKRMLDSLETKPQHTPFGFPFNR